MARIALAPILLSFASALPLAGCYGPALSKHTTDNDAFHVDYLFSHDGCRIYRFIDSGAHYFVRCDGPPSEAPQSSTHSMVSCGKNCVRDEAIQTATRPAEPERR